VATFFETIQKVVTKIILYIF